MPIDSWTASEKKIARRIFEAALQRELDETIARFKAKAAQVQQPDDMWALEDFLRKARRAIDSKYDYRYSQLDLVLARLLREKRIDESELSGFSTERQAFIRGVANL